MRKSRHKRLRLVEHFMAGTTARTGAGLCGVNRKTAVFFFHRLREVIALETEAESEAMFGGEVEVDKSYFGGVRKGQRGARSGLFRPQPMEDPKIQRFRLYFGGSAY